MASHRAVFLDGKGKDWRVADIKTKQPGDNEVLIRAKALAINPVDWKIQDIGFFIEDWPCVLGEDVAGEVEAVGKSVSNFKKGDRVLAHSQFLTSKDNNNGGFQELVLVKEDSIAILPDNLKYEEGAVLPLAVSTAAAGLYQNKSETCLQLPLPTANPKSTGKSLLIWGGSSSVGSAAIQLAVASGIDVVTTCSKRNFEFVQKIGAKAFDYNSLSVVGDLSAELQKGEFVGAYDAIGTRESTMQTAQVVASFGGGIVASVLTPPEDIPATVSAVMVFALTIFMQEGGKVGKAIWGDFLPQALKSGQFKCLPPPEVVGDGIDVVKEACRRQKEGVSAKKIVLTL